MREAKPDLVPLATASHEIRTALHGMMGLVDELLEMPLPAEARKYVESLGACTDHMRQVVTQTLDRAKLEAGAIAPDEIELDVRALAQSVLDFAQPQARAKGLAARLVVAPDVPQRLIGDPVRLRQVLSNLTDNAVKFTAAGGIALEITREETPANSGALHFALRDTGIGIEATVLPRLFTDFQQADASIGRRFGGTGMGLAICRRLVEGMQGTIAVESQLGAGSCFHFTLPFGLTQAASNRRCEGPIRVLLADDDRTSRMIVAKMLERWGCLVEIASNGAEAVASVRSNEHDVVLMDVRMPTLDGLRATRAIRSLVGAARDIPVIALTAEVSATERKRCLSSGMCEIIYKPVESQRLFAAIAAALERDGGLAQYAAGIPDDSLVATFLEETAERLQRMRARAGKRDSAALAREAHALKGAAASFGCHRLAQLAAVAEASAADLGKREMQALTSELAAEFEAELRSISKRATTAA
jgi:two-component system, sensor histidine kinase